MVILRKIGYSETAQEGYTPIYRNDSIACYEQYEEVYSTDIGEGSKRRWQLMNEDLLTLKFSSESNIILKVGDFVWYNNRRFILTKPYRPSDNADNGGYDYDIPFEADYRYAANRIFKLSGKEPGWSLTGDMYDHLEQVRISLQAEGITYRYIENGKICEKDFDYYIQDYTPAGGDNIQTSIKPITYSSKSILDSITLIAETWKCEWWFDAYVLNMGKCEVGEYVNFHRDYLNGEAPNIESIDGQGTSEGQATRLYVYGSKDNIPSRYDRKLIFHQTNISTESGHKIFLDKDRLLNPDMFAEGEGVVIRHPADYRATGDIYGYGNKTQFPISLNGTSDATINLAVRGIAGTNQRWSKYKVEARIYSDNSAKYFSIVSEEIQRSVYGVYNFSLEGSGALFVSGHITIEIIGYGYNENTYKTLDNQERGGMLIDSLSGSYDITSRKVSIDTIVNFGGENKNCTINPTMADESEEAFSQVSVASGDYSSEPYTFPKINVYKVPVEYFTTDNPSGYSERRLHMDDSDEIGDDYIKHGVYIQDKNISDEEVVESILILDDIKPNITLKVVNVNKWTSEERTEEGVKTHIYYDIAIANLDDTPFEFSIDSILKGETLRARFMGNVDPTKNSKLNGMDFDMGFYPQGRDGLKDYQEFEIVNGTIGDNEIPNSVLYPQVGDQLVLYGWDVQSMMMDTLVSNAQTQLKQEAIKWLRKNKIDAGTYTCPMFSDVNNQYEIGRKVKLYSPLFEGGFRASRIVGAELNLDLPWDTPVYTIAQEVSYTTQTSNETLGTIQNIEKEPYILNPTGNKRLPVYIDDSHKAQPIEGLDVPENIRTQKNVEAGYGVAAYGMASLAMNGGGGQGTVTAINFEGSPEQIYTPSDGLITLPDYPTAASLIEDGLASQNYVASYFASNFTQLNIKNTLGISDWALEPTKPTYNFSEIGAKPTTLGGYGISDAHITNGVITLGQNTITPATLNNGKIPLSQIPDAILGQMLYGGTVNGSGVVTLSQNAKDKWGITSLTLTSTNYADYEGAFFIASANGSSGVPSSLGVLVGDWIIATSAGWGKIDNTDAVTGVKGSAESNYRIGNVNITPANIGLGNVENTALSTWAGTNKITTLGTITTGVWHGSAIADDYIASASAWNAKYDKPSGGIPKTDLASAVQTSLGKADTALQSESDPVFTASAAHGITSDDISTWNAKQNALSFDGTYDASTNKVATKSTVTNAINALDVSNISGFGAGKTLASLTETDGKIAATFQDISITKSQVSDFPTTWALSDITGADDLKAIEALTGTSGFLKKTAANTWTLDTDVASGTALSGVGTRVGTLEGYFTSGVANNAAQLGGQLPSYYAKAADYTKTSDFKSFSIKAGATSLGEYSPTSALIITLVAGSNISFTPDATNHKLTINNTYSYTLPIASSDSRGGVRVGSTLNIDSNGILNANIYDGLDQGYTTYALSAKQGKVLKTALDTLNTGLTSKGAHNLPVYLNSSAQAVAIDALSVSGDIQSTAGGVAASGIASLAMNGGGGQGTLTQIQVNGVALADTSGVVNITATTGNAAGKIAIAGQQIPVYGLGSLAYLSSLAFTDLSSHPTTLGEYGITDAKIANGVITLGSNTITPLTSHQTLYNLVINNSAGTAQITYKPAVSGTYALTLTKAMVGLSNVENTKLSTWTGSANITTLGTITTGKWQGTAIADSYIASAATWNAKQDAISDLATIRSNASNGNTAYGWGNHANAGYFAASSFTKANIKSTLEISDWALAASKPSYAFSEITGTVTNAQLAGSIANDKLANSSVSIAGTSVSLGGSITAATLKTNLGLGASAYVGYDTEVTQNSTKLITSGAVYNAIDNLPEPMVFKGSLGTGGTITALPVNGSASIGDTYKVITAGTYASKAAKVGDTFICLTKTSSANTWELIPSGDEPSGTVTSVGLTMPTGFSVSSSPVTTSGTLTVAFASGYSLPTTAKQSNWDTAYGWGNHASAGYALAANLGTASTHAHGDYVTEISWDSTNNKLAWSKGGTAQNAITIGYASSAGKLNTNAGSATNPVYFANGVPVACTYSLNKTVPADAVFTDTNTHRPIQLNGTEILGNNTTALNLKAGTGVSLSNSGGDVTFTNSGVRAATINGNYLRINTNGTNADLTIPYATSAGSVAWGNVSSKPSTFTPTIGTTSTTAAPGNHVYHYLTANGEYFDSYSQDRLFRIVTENMQKDTLRYQANTISNVEYWNYSTSAWTTWNKDLSPLFGEGATDIPYSQRKFRFQITSSSGWPTTAIFMIRGSWFSSGSYTPLSNGKYINVTIETRANTSASFATKLEFGFSNNTQGTNARVTTALHTGETLYRITIELAPWANTSNSPSLSQIGILSNYSGNNIDRLVYNPYGHVRPTANNTTTLGTPSYYWNNVFATTFTENGTALSSKYLGINANAVSATKATNDSDGHAINTTYLKLSGGTMTGPIKWTGRTALPEQTSPQFYLVIDAFDSGGTTKWASTGNVKSALGIATLEGYFSSGVAKNAARLSNTSAIGSTTKPVYFTANGVPSACSDYAGGTAVTLNGSSKAANTASFYAPTGAGTSGQILKSTAGTPEWINQSAITAGALTTVSKTAWGQTYWTSGGVPTNISGDMSSVGNIAFSASGKNIGGTMYFDTNNHRIGINDSTPSCAFDVTGDIQASGGVAAGGILNLAYNGAGTQGTLTQIQINGRALTDSSGIVNIPLANTTSTGDGAMSHTDKLKLDGIATGATNVTTDTVAGWGYVKDATGIANALGYIAARENKKSRLVTGTDYRFQSGDNDCINIWIVSEANVNLYLPYDWDYQTPLRLIIANAYSGTVTVKYKATSGTQKIYSQSDSISLSVGGAALVEMIQFYNNSVGGELTFVTSTSYLQRSITT